MEQTLGVLAQRLNGQIIGDDTVCIRGINTLEAVQAGELAFVEDVRQHPWKLLVRPKNAQSAKP